MIDLHVHLIGHLDRKVSRATIRDFLDRARAVGLREIGFADHDLYWDELDFDLIRETAQEYPELKVRVGLEVDYRPRTEDKIKALLEQYPFDYVIGSVHEIEGWPFDHPKEIERYRQQDGEALYREYFALIKEAASSKLFTTIGHLDIIKIYGAKPQTPIAEVADAALTAIKSHGLAVEINTNGRYKPVGEFYPGDELLQEVSRRGIPITLGSDAHMSQVVGRDLEEATAKLKSLGVESIVSFDQRLPQKINI